MCLVRVFGYRPGVCRSAALLSCVLSALSLASLARGETPPNAARDAAVVQTLLRLPGIDLDARPELKSALLRHMQTHQGTLKYVELAAKFNLREASPHLLDLAASQPEDTAGVQAAGLLLQWEQVDALQAVLQGEDDERAAKLLAALGRTRSPRVAPIALPLLAADRAVLVRRAAVVALGGTLAGEKELLALAARSELAPELHLAAANVLHASSHESIRAAAADALPLPATADAEPLPPLAQLVARTGNAERGGQVFRTQGSCIKCHKLGDDGKEVGPSLAEIGSKLSKEALYVAILEPSAGISHSFETYALALNSGEVLTGLLVSQTDAAVTLKNAEGIVQTVPRSEIEELVKQKISLMPADLQKNLTAADLCDLVEFLTTLKKQS